MEDSEGERERIEFCGVFKSLKSTFFKSCLSILFSSFSFFEVYSNLIFYNLFH